MNNTKKQTKKIDLIKEYEEMRNNGALDNYAGVNDYHYQNNQWRDINNGYGVELETYAPTNMIRYDLSRYLNYKYKMNIERDSSINNGYGMECISQPYTQEEWATHKEDIKAFFDLLEHNKIEVNDSTGLHVHISKKLIGRNDTIRENNINKLILILENFKDTFIKFSRRDKRFLGYCNYYSNYNGVKKAYKDLYTIAKNKSYNHNVAINRDAKTYEIRIFKATMDYKTFIATLQLVFNLVEIINREDISDLTFNDIINLNDNYKELIAYCKDNKISNNAKLIDKTKTMELLQLRENSKVLKENYNYNKYIAKVRDIIINNLELYKKSKEEYNNNSDLYNNLSYIFTQTYRNNNSIYYTISEINNLLSNYNLKYIYNYKTNESIQKRVFNQSYKNKYSELMTRLGKLIKEQAPKEEQQDTTKVVE